jgi:hypothetical protein
MQKNKKKVILKPEAEVIKQAVDMGYEVFCDGGGYKVVKDNLNQYLIKFVDTDFCVGLHNKLTGEMNGVAFYYEEEVNG